MLTIRNEQMKAFADSRQRVFDAEVLFHLKRWFPNQCRALGDEALCALIHSGIGRATEYDIRSTRGVARYVRILLVFGPQFDRDPGGLGWAIEILRNNDVPPEIRAERLHAAAVKMLLAASEHTIRTGGDA